MMSPEFWSPEEYDARAQKHYEAGDYDTALEILRRALVLHPNVVELHVSMGYAELAREEYLWARKAFEQALRLEADHEDALAGIGDALLKLGERARALQAFERVLELGFSGDADLLIGMGRALFREDLCDRAERMFRLAVESDPRSAEAAADLGFVVHRLGRQGEARKWLARALRLDSGHHDARALLGNLLYEAGDRRSALRHFERIPLHLLWDSLTIWRLVELTRAYGDEGASERIDACVRRLEELFSESTPEDRLLEEVELQLEPDGGAPGSPGQLDLFRPVAEDAAGRPEDRRRDWAGIVQEMCRSSTNPDRTVEQYMRETASRLWARTGIRIPDDDPEAFLKASARAGVLHIPD